MRARGAVFLVCLASADVSLPSRSLAQQPGRGAILSGQVVDVNNQPVVGATVTVEGIVETSTDSSGRFAFAGLESETLLLRVRRLGFELTTRVVLFSADESQDLVIRLGARATRLAGMTVLDSADVEPRNYTRRRQTSQGVFLTQQDIRKRGPAPRVENILATIPGLRVEAGVVKVARGRISIIGNNCEDGVQYFVDGAMIGQAFTPRTMAPEQLTGIEVYTTAAATPPEYRTMKTACGTVVLWTH